MSKLTRRELLRGACGAAVGGLMAQAAAPARAATGEAITGMATVETSRLNFIFILTDDQGYGDLGCQGHPVLRTPHLDRFAAQSCRLTDMVVCTPVCAPSRAGCMTGRDPNRYGMKFLCNDGQFDAPLYHFVPPEEPMLPRLLRQAGYRTGHIGKWHLSLLKYGELGVPGPEEYGFDHWLLLEPSGSGLYRNPRGWNRNGETLQEELPEWTAELYIDEALRFIDACGEQPFFLNIWPFTPHETIVTPEEYKRQYSQLSEAEQIYYGSITQFDDQLGRFFDFLRERGLERNTVIIFASDNGPEHPLLPWGENSRGSTGPWRGSKHNLYEGGIRVPGIIHWPGLTQPGSVSTSTVSTLDLMPTLLAAMGIDLPEGLAFDGGDFRPALRGEAVERPHPLFWQYDRSRDLLHRGELFTSPPVAIRQKSWKLLCELDGSRPELYNFDFDRGEKWNLAEQYPEIASDLLKQAKAQLDAIAKDAEDAQFLNPRITDARKPAA